MRRLGSVGILALSIGCSAPAARAPAGALVLRPGVGFDLLPLGATEAQARAAFGEPESVVNERIWEYFGRCATLVFDDAGRVTMMTIGDGGGLDEIEGRCRNVAVEGGTRLRDSFEQVRTAFPEGREKVVGAGKRGWDLPARQTRFVFQRDRLHWVVTQSPTRTAAPGDDTPAPP